MPVSSADIKDALVAAGRQELARLTACGVRIHGNAASPIVLIKGQLNSDELAGEALLSGADGKALRAALSAVGYAPEDFCALATVAGASGDESQTVAPGEELTTDLFREALEALDPEAVLVLDETAAQLLRETYADALVVIEDFDSAMLKPGLVVPVLGRRVLVLDGFEAALADKGQKQRMWAYIKQLHPAGAPY